MIISDCNKILIELVVKICLSFDNFEILNNFEFSMKFV